MGTVTIRAKGVGGTYPVARVGDSHNCHKICSSGVHIGGAIYQGSPTVKANGMPVGRVGDDAHCHPVSDSISEGVPPILVDGNPIARVGNKCDHGGVITSGSDNVFVADSLGPTTVMPQMPSFKNGSSVVGTHWIQGQFVGAKPGTTWKIRHMDGTVKAGVVDSDGKTTLVTTLKPGTAKITFGDREKLQAQLVQQRTKLKTALDQIIAKAKAQQQTDQTLLAKKPWWDDVYLCGKGFAVSAGTGAAHMVEQTGHMVKSMFEATGDMIALSARIDKDEVTGNTADLAAVQQQVDTKVQAIIAKLKAGYSVMQNIYDDAETRSILENFAEEYYHTQTGLLLFQDVGNFTGGMIPALVLGIVTDQPEALGAGFSEEVTGEVGEAASEIAGIEKTLEEIEDTAEIPEAETNNLHIIDKTKKRIPLPPEYVQKFQNGGSALMSKSNYTLYLKNEDFFGRADGQFITTKQDMDDLIAKSNGDLSVVNRDLGLSLGGQEIIRVDVTDPLNYNPRMATADMSGANENFLGKGETPGKQPEIVIDRVPKSFVTISTILFSGE